MDQRKFEILENIIKKDPLQLYESMANILRKCYGANNIIQGDEFIYAQGETPIMLVAHMDTVFPKVPQELFWDKEKNVLWSPWGAGFDDRAGVFAIYLLLAYHYRPSVLLTLGEEAGGYGAIEAGEIIHPIEGVKYVVELDRRGEKDCVFYDEENEDFKNYIKSFGFVEADGIFSDICLLAPAWGLPCVNLSIGYQDEHTYSERLYCNHFFATLEKVRKMLIEADKAPQFYSELTPFFFCDYCHKPVYRNDEAMFIDTSKRSTLCLCRNCYDKNRDKFAQFRKSTYPFFEEDNEDNNDARGTSSTNSTVQYSITEVEDI